MKLPKLGDLTDLNKLKEMGSSIAGSAKVGDVMNKMKQAVGESGKLVDKARSSVGLGAAQAGSADSKTVVGQIQESLSAIFAAQKAQLAAMNQLKHAVDALIKQSGHEPEESTSTQDDEHPVTGDDDNDANP